MVSANSVSVLSTSIAVITAAVAMFLLVFKNSFDSLPSWMYSVLTVLAIPLVGYGLSVLGSTIYQYGKCKKVDLKGIALSNTAVLGTLAFMSSVLAFEQVPILKYIFGPYGPRNPMTGEFYPEDSMEYTKGMEDENHYKIQWLSNIVKVVLPVYTSESVKDGFAYAYWIFFMTLLPTYFLMSLQGTC